MNRLDRYIIGAAVTAIVVFLVWYFSDIVGYILVSAILSLMGKPLVDLLGRIRLGRFRMPKWLAAGLTLGTMIGLAYLFAALLVPLVVEKINSLSQYNVSDLVALFREPLEKLQHFFHENVPATARDLSLQADLGKKLSEFFNLSVTGVTSLVNFLGHFVVAVFSVGFITFFFLKEDQLFFDGVVLLFPNKYESNVKRALSSTITLLSRYFIGLLAESTIKLIAIAVGLWTIGLPFQDAVVIALISAILNIIPYIGPLLGGAIGILIGIASPAEGLTTSQLVIQMIAVFTVFQVLDNLILQPYIYSSSVKAHPLEIFLVILAAGSMAGILGMLLAIPAYTVLRVFAKEFFNHFRIVRKLTENI